MPIYCDAPADCLEIYNQVMNQYHSHLVEYGVTVDILFAKLKAEEAKPGASAVRLHGYPCAAVVKVNSYKLRVQGHSDAEIVIDGDMWNDWSYEQRVALMDHELEHLELKMDKDENPTQDDLGRQKLKVKHHDHEFGWFDSIARRHGENSPEVRQYEAFRDLQPELWAPQEEEEEADTDEAISEAAEKFKRQNFYNPVTGQIEEAEVA